MQKTSKTISVFIRNHQYKDGQGFRITTFGESNIHHQSCSVPMRESDIVDYRCFTQTSLQDRISETNRDALKKLHMTLTEEEKTYSSREKEVQVTDSYDEVETTCTYTYAEAEVEITDTESTPKPKSNKWKWIAGVAAGTGLAGMIAYVFKTK